MEKYCVNDRNELLDGINENRNSFDKKSKCCKTSSSNIKECFTEYSLEDKVEALKNILCHNEKHRQNEPSHINNIRNIKKTIGVKECLYTNQETPFQTIISELRNTVVNSYWNKEVGKTRYQVPNLPIGMNPLGVTFGKKSESGEPMAELLREQVNKNDILKEDILEMYKKSHKSYLPGEQSKRYYKKPFDQNLHFGKPTNVSNKGTKMKRLLSWINTDSKVPGFIECSCSEVAEVRNLKNTDVFKNMVHGKKSGQKEQEIKNILNECSPNNESTMLHNYLQYIDNLRQKLKKYVPEIPFRDILEDLIYIDKDYTDMLPEEKVFSVLTKYKIHVNETLLMPLLDLLQIHKGKDVNYKALLNLLSWKYHVPTLPKIEKLLLECQYYNTTYNETIGNIKERDTTSISPAGISYESAENKTTSYSLIFPDIFTRYGLSHLDFSKPRSKEEIKSIFESCGIQFPNDSFDVLWEEELKKSGKNNLSIKNFKNLFGHYNY